MKMTIEVESLDDLISLIGLVRVMQDKKPEPAPKATEQPVVVNRIERPSTAELASNKIKEADDKARKERMFQEFLSYKIDALKLWPPAERSLKEWGFEKVIHLFYSSPRKLKDIENVGVFTIKQIRDAFAARGSVWHGEVHDSK